MRAPQDVPWEINEAFGYDVGVATAYSGKAYGHPDRPIDFVMRSRTESALLTQLGKWDDIERASRAVLTAPHMVDKEAYKARLSFYFRWSVGNKLDVDAASFQRVMGRPSQTQTVQLGSDPMTMWYYQCADGTVQLVADARLLANGGRLQATVNDY